MRHTHREQGADFRIVHPALPHAASVQLFSIGIASAITSSACGQINFDWPVQLDDPDWGIFVAADDFDLDGLLDIAVTKRGVGAEILQNNGDGTFSHYSDAGFTTSSAGGLLRARDVDADGDADLVWVVFGSPDKVTMAINDGDGLTWTVSQSDVTPDVNDLTIGNIDEDGDLDVIVTTGSGVSVIETESGSLKRARLVYDRSFDDYDSIELEVGDYDRDGDQDIATLFVDGASYVTYTEDYYKVYGSEVVFLWNDGSGRFTQSETVTLPYQDRIRKTPRALAAGDLDGDSDLDLVLAVGDTDYERPWLPAEFRVIRNEDAGQSFTVESAHPFGHGDCRAVELGDLDTDGRIDLLMTTREQTALQVVRNLGPDGFDQARPFPTGNEDAIAIHPRDVTDDGQLDVFVGGDAGISLLDNLTAIDNPRIDAPTLYRGETAEILISGLRSSERAYIAVSGRGWRPSLGVSYFGNMTFDIGAPPLTTAVFQADSNGNAVLRFNVPARMRPGLAMFQLAARRGPNGSRSVKSTFETTVVIDR